MRKQELQRSHWLLPGTYTEHWNKLCKGLHLFRCQVDPRRLKSRGRRRRGISGGGGAIVDTKCGPRGIRRYRGSSCGRETKDAAIVGAWRSKGRRLFLG